MFIAKVTGNVVTTQKVAKMAGAKLLIIEPLCVNENDKTFAPTKRSFVAIDAVGAGAGEMVLVTQGSSARMTDMTSDAPVDCVIIGIIDSVNVPGGVVYEK
ncbi:MAG: EutN/CcmL family microcompartment protein [Planctomycetota bacterium]|nr:EutN/CcmL family microcompartment protein [Planctomycetota bacterium]